MHFSILAIFSPGKNYIRDHGVWQETITIQPASKYTIQIISIVKPAKAKSQIFYYSMAYPIISPFVHIMYMHTFPSMLKLQKLKPQYFGVLVANTHIRGSQSEDFRM